MKDSQLRGSGTFYTDKYIKANNERFSTAARVPVASS